MMIGNGLFLGMRSGGGGAPPPPLDDPSEILGANLIGWWNAAAANVTKDGGDIVSSVADLSAGAHPLADVANGPLWVDNQINGHPVFRFDGTAQRLSNATLDLIAPGTSPTVYWMILRQLAGYVSGEEIVSGGTLSRASIRQSGTSPALVMLCATSANSNVGALIDTASRVAAKFNGSTADYLKCRASHVTGTSAGTTNPGVGFFVGCRPGNTNFGNFELAELVIANLDLAHDSAQVAALDAWGADKYGAAVLA